MKKQIKRAKSIKNKIIIPLAFHQIEFDWVKPQRTKTKSNNFRHAALKHFCKLLKYFRYFF